MSTLTDLQMGRFVSEVEVQTAFAYYAYQQIYAWMGKKDTAQERQIEGMFFYVHAMLSHTANLSKLLWPIPPRNKKGKSKEDFALRVADQEARGKELRAALNVPDDSVLQHRIVRDHFEHYDERLEEFVRTGGQAGLLDLAIGSPETMPHLGATPHRYFTPWQMLISYQQDTMSLIEVAEAIRKLRKAARRWLFDHGHWDREDEEAYYNQPRWDWEREGE